MSATYEYWFLTPGQLPTPHQALAVALAKVTGAEVVGQFAPMLGWSTNEAAALLRRPGHDPATPTDLGAPLVIAHSVERLRPTIRPGDGDRLCADGIYVHRWFEVEAAAVDEFVDLSGQGWQRFEAHFDARIFGLFRADPDDRDAAHGLARLLLITRYADHGVWEDSRDPTSEAMQIFARRQRLTRRSWAASTRLVSARALT
jgi:hypothetical protein